MNSCFTCLNCGKVNPVKGHSYTNKYCNNSCQQQHRSRLLVQEWKQTEGQTAWRHVPEYVKKYLIEQRGYRCEECGNDIPLARQQAVPGVRLCIECQNFQEKLRKFSATSGQNA